MIECAAMFMVRERMIECAAMLIECAAMFMVRENDTMCSDVYGVRE